MVVSGSTGRPSAGQTCEFSVSHASIPVSGLGRRSAALGGPLEGWLVASKGLAALPRTKGSTLAYGCGSEGSLALPLARKAVIWTS